MHKVFYIFVVIVFVFQLWILNDAYEKNHVSVLETWRWIMKTCKKRLWTIRRRCSFTLLLSSVFSICNIFLGQQNSRFSSIFLQIFQHYLFFIEVIVFFIVIIYTYPNTKHELQLFNTCRFPLDSSDLDEFGCSGEFGESDGCGGESEDFGHLVGIWQLWWVS